MKREYLELELEIVKWLQDDVLTISNEGDVTSDPYGSDNRWWETNN